MTELAKQTSRHAGTQITYTDMPAAEYAKTLAAAGLPKVLADAIADNSAGAVRGAWQTDGTDLQHLLGRPSTSW